MVSTSQLTCNNCVKHYVPTNIPPKTQSPPTGIDGNRRMARKSGSPVHGDHRQGAQKKMRSSSFIGYVGHIDMQYSKWENTTVPSATECLLKRLPQKPLLPTGTPRKHGHEAAKRCAKDGKRGDPSLRAPQHIGTAAGHMPAYIQTNGYVPAQHNPRLATLPPKTRHISLCRVLGRAVSTLRCGCGCNTPYWPELTNTWENTQHFDWGQGMFRVVWTFGTNRCMVLLAGTVGRSSY